MRFPQTLFAIVLLAAPQVRCADNERTEKEKADEWVLLFDGKTPRRLDDQRRPAE